MKSIKVTVAVLASLMLNGAAFAVETTDIRAAMVEGDYAAAYTQAKQLTTADGYAIAAEALLLEIILGQAEKNKKQAKRARKLSEAALELDPSHQNARLQYAIADGFVTREASDVSAWMKKLPQKTQAVVQSYRADFPTDSRGDALLGAWHMAIARKTGNENGEKWFGATITQGRGLFQKARIAQPDDIVVDLTYAFSLLVLKDKDFAYLEEARQILTRVTATEPTDHLGRVLQSYAREALTQIEDRDGMRDYAALFLDGEVPVFE